MPHYEALCALIEQGLEAGVAGFAYGEAGVVGEDGEAAVFGVGFDADYAFEIDDVGAVDADEAVGIEAGFEAGDGLLFEVFFSFGR